MEAYPMNKAETNATNTETGLVLKKIVLCDLDQDEIVNDKFDPAASESIRANTTTCACCV